MATTIKVSHRVKAMLKERKEALGVRSVDEVLERQLTESQEEVGAGTAAGVRRKRVRRAEEEEEEKRVPQLLSYEILVREPAALKWFTGMKEQALNWTMEALRDAVIILSSFNGFAFCGDIKVAWAMMLAVIVVPSNLALLAEEEHPDA